MIRLKDIIKESEFENELKKWCRAGVEDARFKTKRDLDNISPEFVRAYKIGYTKAKGSGLWDKVNSGLTDFISRIGSSLVNK